MVDSAVVLYAVKLVVGYNVTAKVYFNEFYFLGIKGLILTSFRSNDFLSGLDDKVFLKVVYCVLD